MYSSLAVCIDWAGQLTGVQKWGARMLDACTYPLKITPEDKY